MSDDGVSRSAARMATLVAMPLALLAGIGSFAALGGFDGGRDADSGSGGGPASTAPATPLPAPTGPVSMAAPELSDRAEVVCRALLSRLPDTLRDRARRPVSAGPEQNAAYGDPPITVACGAPAASFPATDLVYALDKVCWHAAERPTETVWTTVDREVPVRVTVPRAYPEPGQWVITLSAPLTATVPAAPSSPPPGCTS